MSGRHAVVALAVGLFATSASADNAVRRDGSSGGSSDAGSRSPSAHSSGDRSSGGGGGRSGDSSASSDSGRSDSGRSHSGNLTAAERRQPRPGTGTGGRNHGYYPGRGYGGYGGYGYGYGSYWPYASFYGYYGSGYYPSGGYYPYGRVYSYAAYDDRASLRILVEPSKARVYVDGYYAGVVDDFDGLFQRLYVSPGRHDIALKMEGFQPHRVKVYVGSGATLKVHYDMQKGSGPETVEDLAGDVDDRYDPRDARRERDAEPQEDDRPMLRQDDRPVLRQDARPVLRHDDADRGRLRLSVLPEDASVYVDGQFKGSARQTGSLDLPVGRHRLEVVRPGFRTEERDVEIENASTRELSLELQRP